MKNTPTITPTRPNSGATNSTVSQAEMNTIKKGFHRADGISEAEIETIKQGFHRASGLTKTEKSSGIDKAGNQGISKKTTGANSGSGTISGGKNSPKLVMGKLIRLWNEDKAEFKKYHAKMLKNNPILMEQITPALEAKGIVIAYSGADGITDSELATVEVGFHRADGANFVNAEGITDIDNTLILESEAGQGVPMDNSNFYHTDGSPSHFSASGKKKKKKSKAGRILAAIFTGGASELVNKQAKDTKKIVQKAAEKRAAKGKKPILKGKIGDKIRAKMEAKKKADAAKKAAAIKKIAESSKLKNTPIKTTIAKNIYNDRLLKNELLKTQGAKTLPMNLPPSINEQKEAVTQYVYDNPQQAPQQIIDYSYMYPEIQQAIPLPQEAAHYGSQQEVMQYYEQNIAQEKPEYYEEIQDTQQMPEEYIEEQSYEEDSYSEQETGESDASEEGENGSGEQYEGFDSQISTGINSDALNIFRYDTVYKSFDADYFGVDADDAQDDNDSDTQIQSEYYGITEEEKAVKRAAKQKEKEAKEAAKAAKKAAKPQTDKGKKTTAALAGIGSALLNAAPAIIDSVKGNSAQYQAGQDSSGLQGVDETGNTSTDNTGQTILLVSGIVIVAGLVFYIGRSMYMANQVKGK